MLQALKSGRYAQLTFLFCKIDHPNKNIAIIIVIAEIARIALE